MFLKKHWTFFEKHLAFSKKQRYVFFDGWVKLELFSNEK